MVFNTLAPGAGGGGGGDSSAELQGILEGTITHIDIPEGTTKICSSAFQASDLQTVTIPDSVTTIDQVAFGMCGYLQSIEIPSGVTVINEGTFDYCGSLASVTLHEGLTELGDWAFGNCTFTSIELPSTLTTLGKNAIHNCRSLTTVTVKATTPPSLVSGYPPFDGDSRLATIYVPSASVDAYKSAWSTYSSKIQAIS